MGLFEIEADGKTYEVEAPSQGEAVAAFQKFSAPKEEKPSALARAWENPPKGPSLIGMAKSLYEGFQAPGKVLASETPISTEEMIQPAAKMASIPMLATTGAPTGALGSGMVRGGVSVRPNPKGAAADAMQPNPLMESADALGVPIPKFLASDDMLTQRMAAGVKNIPGAGDEIYKATQKTTEAMGGAAKGVEQELGAGSPVVAGGASKDAISDWVTDGGKQVSSRVYGSVDKLVKPDVSRELHATREAVSEVMAKRANSRIGGASPAVDLVKDGIQSGGMNYEGVKGLRTFLGEMTPQEMVTKGVKKQEADRLYAALTEDLKGTILDAGGPEALKAFERANTVHSQIKGRQKELSKIIGAKGDAAPEAVFSKLVAMAGSKQTADISKLQIARKTMGPEAWKEVSSAIVSKMGRDAQDNFSPDRFITAYAGLSNEAKTILFRGEHGQALKHLFNLSEGFKDRIGKFANPSGTAQNMQGASMVTQLTHEPLKLMSTLIGGNALARALSEPATAKSMTIWAMEQKKVASNPGHVSSAAYRAATRNLANLLGDKNLMQQLEAIVTARPGDNEPSAQRMNVR